MGPRYSGSAGRGFCWPTMGWYPVGRPASRLQAEVVDDLAHGECPLELLGYERGPLVLLALHVAAVLVEAQPGRLLGVDDDGGKADGLLEQLSKRRAGASLSG